MSGYIFVEKSKWMSGTLESPSGAVMPSLSNGSFSLLSVRNWLLPVRKEKHDSHGSKKEKTSNIEV